MKEKLFSVLFCPRKSWLFYRKQKKYKLIYLLSHFTVNSRKKLEHTFSAVCLGISSATSSFVIFSVFMFPEMTVLLHFPLPFLQLPTTWSSLSFQFSRSVVSDSLQPHESQHTRPPCPSPTPGVHSNSRPSSRWCHPAISSSVLPFSSCPQSLPASESFPMSQLFAWGGQSTGVSVLASLLPKNTQD